MKKLMKGLGLPLALIGAAAFFSACQGPSLAIGTLTGKAAVSLGGSAAYLAKAAQAGAAGQPGARLIVPGTAMVQVSVVKNDITVLSQSYAADTEALTGLTFYLDVPVGEGYTFNFALVDGNNHTLGTGSTVADIDPYGYNVVSATIAPTTNSDVILAFAMATFQTLPDSAMSVYRVNYSIDAQNPQSSLKIGGQAATGGTGIGYLFDSDGTFVGAFVISSSLSSNDDMLSFSAFAQLGHTNDYMFVVIDGLAGQNVALYQSLP